MRQDVTGCSGRATIRSPMSSPDRYALAIASRIATARRLASLGQKELAARIGTNERAVRSWEAGRNMPDADMIGRLAVETGRSADWILGRPDGDPVCLIHAGIEAGMLAGERADSSALIRQLRLAIVVGEEVESVPLAEFSRRLAAVAGRISKESTRGAT